MRYTKAKDSHAYHLVLVLKIGEKHFAKLV